MLTLDVQNSEETSEAKRLAAIETMKKTRFPRVGDPCVFVISLTTQPATTAHDSVRVISLSSDRSQIWFVNNFGTTYACAVNDYGGKWWFADDDARTSNPIESCYDSSILRGVAKANKLKTVWNILRSVLGEASASLSKTVGQVVSLDLIKIPANEIPFTTRSFHESPHEPGPLWTGIRLRCPVLQYESHLLAYVRSYPEGLPFWFTYEADSVFFYNDVMDDEQGLQAQLRSSMKHLLSGIQTGIVVRSLMDRTKPPEVQHVPRIRG